MEGFSSSFLTFLGVSVDLDVKCDIITKVDFSLWIVINYFYL